MDNRFSRLFNLTEEQAIEILDSPADDSDEASSRYIAASHLVNFNTDAAIASLMRAVNNADPDLDNRIVRRKAMESLGRLKVEAALPAIKDCLNDEDAYLVENAAWALSEIGTEDATTLEKLSEQLDRPEQSYRTIIHALASLDYKPAAERIKPFTSHEKAPIACAALAALYRLTGDDTAIPQVMKYLQSDNVNARRGSIQDLIDANYYRAIPHIARCPVSSVFRLRAIKSLAKAGMADGKLTFEQVQPILEAVLRDHPDDVAMVHMYDQVLELKLLVQELYGTDFGRCYLATQALIEHYAEATPAALFESYEATGYNDYGAHYHIMRLFGWLTVADGYDLLVEALHNKAPQFQKSRTAAAIALGELGDARAIPELKTALGVPIWDLQYAAIMALDKLGIQLGVSSEHDFAAISGLNVADADWLVQEKLASA